MRLIDQPSLPLIERPEGQDELLWRQEYEEWKRSELTRLAACNCPNCRRELNFQATLITDGHPSSIAVNDKVSYFGDIVEMRRRITERPTRNLPQGIK